MLETFLFSIISGIINKLDANAVRETALSWGFGEDLRNLHTTLLQIRDVILDAEQKAETSRELREWIGKVEDVCYAINDVVDELELLDLQQQILRRSSITRKVCCFFTSSNPLMVRLRMGRKIKEMLKSLYEIQANRGTPIMPSDTPNSSFADNSLIKPHDTLAGNLQVFGREKDKTAVLKLLLADSSENDEGFPEVLSIVGIGGIGKTTLTQLVYNDPIVRTHFELKSWVSVSQDFHVSRLIRSIIESLTGTSCDESNIGLLASRLREVLRGKRFLLVLDDVWDEDSTKWADMKSVLVGGAKGSKIIVTTRSSSAVAAIVDTHPSHYVSPLSPVESMSLFTSYVFQGAMVHSSELLSIGKDIVEMCGGVPLATRIIASFLHSKVRKEEWLAVRDQLSIPSDNSTHQVLKLSYDYLPSHLKQCFAILSTFPEDSTIMSTTLICRWIAQGALRSIDATEDLEQIGENCIRELASRSLILFSDCGYYSLIRVHDLIHDVALSVAGYGYAVVGNQTTRLPQHIRHLTFRDADVFSKQGADCLEELKKVLTVTHFHKVVPNKPYVKFCISRFKSLRALYLRHSPITALPHNIKSLKYLTLLDLSCNENIKHLPNSICKLQALQTLNLYMCVQLETLPKDFGMLINLRFLHLTTQDGCFSAEVFGKLTSLRQLYISACYNLKHLFDDGDEIRMESGLCGLRSLGIYNCTKLLSLPRGLKYLTAIKSLTICECRKLDLNMNIEGDGGLRSLQYLGIAGLPKLVALPHWLVESAANTLRQVVILSCYKFIAFPQDLTLSRLHLENCPQLASLPRKINCRALLKELVVVNCPELVKWCKSENGQEWQKLTSIPDIYLDGNKIQSDGNNQSIGERNWFKSTSLLLMMEGIKDGEASVY